MSDFDEIIQMCVDDIWAHLQYDNSCRLDKTQVKMFVCTMNAQNNYVDYDFEYKFRKFGKTDNSTLDKDELISFIKYMNDLKPKNDPIADVDLKVCQGILN